MSTLIDRHEASALIDPVGVRLQVISSTVTLDEARAPYIEAEFVCALPDPATRELLDLRVRELGVQATWRRDFGATWSLADLTAAGGHTVDGITTLGGSLAALTGRFYRPWNQGRVLRSDRLTARLLVSEIAFDELEQTVRVRAYSGEARLLGDALLAPGPLDPGTTSTNTLVDWVLDRYGAALAETPADVAVPEVDATHWQPGVTAWDYLDAMLEAVDRRLWCDEAGLWRLTTRQPTRPGSVRLAPGQGLTRLVDELTLDPATFFDAVLVKYQWVDAFDLTQTVYDYAGPQPARAVLTVDRATPYPGPGAAAGILHRAAGRGRRFALDAVADPTVRPGMPVMLTPLAGDTQTGFVQAVTLTHPDAVMQVTTRGLVDTPATAYLFGPTGYAYNDVPPGTDYLEFDWSLA